MRTVTALVMVLLLGLATQAESIAFEKALKEGKISVRNVRSIGGHQGQNMELYLQNNTKKDLQVNFYAGWIFDAPDEDYQDMILVQQKRVLVSVNGKKKVLLYTLCTEKNDHGPAPDMAYTLGTKATDNLLHIANFIADRSYHTEDAAQAAVWVITDNQDLSTVYSYNPTVQRDLINFLADLTSQEIPWYSVEQLVEPGEPPVERTLKADFGFRTDQTVRATFGVYDEQGDTIQIFFANRKMPAGQHQLNMTLRAYNLPPGNYYVRAHNGPTIWEERVITLRE